MAWWLLAIVGWLISTLVFVTVCTKLNDTAPLESPWFLIVILAFWICLSIALSRWQKVRLSRTQAAEVKQTTSEMADIFTFSVLEAIRVEEFEDEGSHYFLRLASGKVLFLSGQYLYDYEFPCTDFDLVWNSQREFVIEVITRGTPLVPVKTLSPFRTEHFERGLVPQDMSYVDISWGDIERTFSPNS